jgi:protoheme IX farnesyltransferase
VAHTEFPVTVKASAPWEVPVSKTSVAPSRGRSGLFFRDLIALTKPRITALVLLTEAAGMQIAPASPGPRARWLSIIGTALIVSSANALNMWCERDVDGQMSRTRNRPLPAGRLLPDVALAFGLALAFVSVPMLFLVNIATGLLGLVSLVAYVAVYTPLKRRSHLALLVGAVPGAIPPLLGWTTATGRLGLGGLLIFLFLFLWQVPHFAAIALFRMDDYGRAGLQVVSVQHGERAAREMIALWTVLLVTSSLLFEPFGMAGPVYELAALAAGVGFLALAFRGLRGGPRFDATRWARRVFAFSIPYLAVLLLVLVVDHAPK